MLLVVYGDDDRVPRLSHPRRCVPAPGSTAREYTRAIARPIIPGTALRHLLQTNWGAAARSLVRVIVLLWPVLAGGRVSFLLRHTLNSSSCHHVHATGHQRVLQPLLQRQYQPRTTPGGITPASPFIRSRCRCESCSRSRARRFSRTRSRPCSAHSASCSGSCRSTTRWVLLLPFELWLLGLGLIYSPANSLSPSARRCFPESSSVFRRSRSSGCRIRCSACSRCCPGRFGLSSGSCAEGAGKDALALGLGPPAALLSGHPGARCTSTQSLRAYSALRLLSCGFLSLTPHVAAGSSFFRCSWVWRERLLS